MCKVTHYPQIATPISSRVLGGLIASGYHIPIFPPLHGHFIPQRLRLVPVLTSAIVPRKRSAFYAKKLSLNTDEL